ncbi:MAG: DUF559 domain-containing protein [Rhizomicrobium sp.]
MRNAEQRSTVQAKVLRRNMTHAEALLWSRLRRTPGLHIRRQHPIGPFIVDFACFAARLVIEVDGSVHESVAVCARDTARDDFLIAHGWHVLRLSNRDVFSDVEGAAGRVREVVFALAARAPTVMPLA